MTQPTLKIIEREIKESIESELNRTGIMYRLYSRIKDNNSILEKIDRKKYNESKKMTDIIGFRVVTYFNDDISIVSKLFRQKFNIIDDAIDIPHPNVFEPIRKNITCQLDDIKAKMFDELRHVDKSYGLTTNTFEIQFRTTLSEGWHEVEHNMRYKCRLEWHDFDYENRIFNGIYAALESLDHTMKSMFDDLSYSHYRTKNWEAMLRNSFRVRFILAPLNESIKKILTDNEELAKALFKISRTEILEKIIDSNLKMRITMDNFVFLLNFLKLKNEDILLLTPTILQDDFKYCFSE